MAPCLAYMINITNPLMFNRTGKFEALSSKWTHSVQTYRGLRTYLSKQREISICNTRMSNILLPQDNTCYFSRHLPSPVMRKELGGVIVSRNAVFTGFIFHANVLFLYPDWFPIKLMEDVMISSCQFKNHCFILKESFFL